ncbi:dihydroneopterin triphosphate diphosphatase [Zobellella maritima]|uniref:dihydroneopterin triphosphate diphosphatase n=1 Tax=Zobellella maritima TaxID=2059725 RepID=UPI000E303CCD|nr:dihydroneopterin triphosphate diphosphatase [Zobellella maritima]
MAFKHPESVLVLIHTPDQVLLLQRKDNPDFWQSVTGSLEPGESRMQAAARELEEETGLRLDKGLALVETGHKVRFEIYPRWRHRYRPGVTHNWEYEFHLCVPEPLEVCLSEHLAQAWLPLEQARHQASSWTNKEAIDRLINIRNSGEETYGRS